MTDSVPATQPSSSVRVSPRRGRAWKHTLRVLIGVAVLTCICLGTVAWYASTPAFQERVRLKLIATLEQVTGGRVELQGFRWRLIHLEFEVDNLTIHGLEPAGEIPYAHVDHLRVRAKVLSFFHPSVKLTLLEAEHPVFHLIVLPDGSTNQPKPKTVREGKPLNDMLFDLAVDQTDISNGVAIVNEQSIPFDLAGNDVGIKVRYFPDRKGRDRYSCSLSVSDLMAHRRRQPEVHSRLYVDIDLHRNSAELESLRLQTGSSLLRASGQLTDFANPNWKLTADGTVDIREVEALTEVEGLKRGLTELHLKGQGAAPARFLIEGNATITDGAYKTGEVDVSGVKANTDVRATQSELVLTKMNARLRQGGSIAGELRILRWLGVAPEDQLRELPPKSTAKQGKKNGTVIPEPKRAPKPPAVAVEQGIIRAQLHDVSLHTILEAVAPPRMQELGFNTLASGKVAVDWVGSASDLTTDAQISLAPSSTHVAGEVPLSGTVDAEYFHRRGTVQIRNLTAQTPATHLQVHGDLGVYPLSRDSGLQGTLITTNLAEFDRTLVAMGVSSEGRQGAQALPVQLHGQAEFQGTVSGTIVNPDVKGHVSASNFVTLLRTADSTPSDAAHQNGPQAESVHTIHWDQVDADAEYSEQLFSVKQATIRRGNTFIHTSGELHAHLVHPKVYAFDENSSINATVSVQNGSVSEVMDMTGQSLPVTGQFNLNAHGGGFLNNLNGGGHLAVTGGEIYGEHYRSLNADLQFSGRDVGVSKLSLLQNGGEITASGDYDLGSHAFHVNAQGKGFELAHFHRLQTFKNPIGGKLSFEANGSGLLDNPMFHANAHLSSLTLGTEALGSVEADAHAEHRTLFYTANSTLKVANIHVSGQTELTGEYMTQAQLTVNQFDLEPILSIAGLQAIKGQSSIAGKVSLSGPAKQPKKMRGEAQLDQFSFAIEGVPLQSDGQVHAMLEDGVLHLDPVHVTGEETDLHLKGSVGLFERHDLNVHGDGTVNLKLLQTLNADITSSGHVNLTMDASGTTEKPNLTGQVKLANVSMTLGDLPNGLNQMNGTLQFNQDRLEVKDLTAYTGGGQLKIGGFLTYQQGLYGDLNATGKDVRIRYPQGVSSVADASLRLQGQPKNLLLSGSVLITRFAVNPDIDFAALAGSSVTVPAPPDPNSPSSHVRLDLHITSAPQLNFQNTLAKLAGDVDLRVRGTVASPSVLGRVNITDGSATFGGTQYQLQRGDIYFTNPVRIEPNIDLDATARVEQYDISIGLHGTPGKLNVSYRSEPPLPPADVIALLAMGRTQDEQSISAQQTAASGGSPMTNAILSGALNATISNRVQKLFGVGSVKIDPNYVGTLGTSTARVSVEQQVSKGVILTYATNVNSNTQQFIQAQVNITRNVSLVTTRDESGVFSLVVKVHRRYR